MIHFSALLSLSFLTSCAHFENEKKDSNKLSKSPRVLDVERKMREHEEAKQDRSDLNRVAAKKIGQSDTSSFKIRGQPQNRSVTVNPIAIIPSSNLTDQQLYDELVGSYDRNNEIAFFSRLQAFNQKFTKSPLADDALYLAGLMSLSNKNYGPALKYFNQVLKQYPTSNKAAGALFAKGVTLKKMNLDAESKKVLLSVKKKYPGSPESLRTEIELKTFNR